MSIPEPPGPIGFRPCAQCHANRQRGAGPMVMCASCSQNTLTIAWLTMLARRAANIGAALDAALGVECDHVYRLEYPPRASCPKCGKRLPLAT